MAERTIFLKKRPLRIEGISGGTVTPGMNVILGSDGKYTAGPVAAAAPSDVPLTIAFENELANFNGITDHTIDTNYVINDRLYMGILDPGAEFYALLPAAAAAIVIGAKLQYAATAGMFQIASTGVVKAVALEAVDNSAGGTPARIILRAV